MKEGIDIEIFFDTPSIADIHKTVSSIINQLNLSHIKHNIFFSNVSQNSDCPKEIARITDAGLKVSKSSQNYKYFLSIKSGDILSSSYIYKAIHYLKNNPVTYVCPEYTFQKISQSDIIVTSINNNRLISQIKSPLINQQKLLSKDKDTVKSTTIKDTCLVCSTYQGNFYHYFKNLKQTDTYFDSPLFQPSKISDFKPSTKSPNIIPGIIKSLRKDLSTILRRNRRSNEFNNHNYHYDPVIPYISPEIKHELNLLSSINYDYKGFESMRFFDVVKDADQTALSLFKNMQSVSHNLHNDHYDYIMILPWIISGGADLFAINYLNTIATIKPNYKILALLTNGTRPSLPVSKLNLADNIEVLDLSTIIENYNDQDKSSLELLHSLINVLSPKTIHIMASKLGYDCVIKYGDHLRNNTKIIFTSYNYLVNNKGEYTGYSVEELPRAYRPGDIITTDNTKSKLLWTDHYGFIENDILVHNQLFDTSRLPETTPTSKNGINILWAAHVRPEKNPEILLPIAESLAKDNIQIYCYGLFNPDNWETRQNPLNTNIANLHYCGPYENFFTDINLAKYDLFLYTSHSDGTPNVVLEAGLAGLPIVSTSVGGIPNAIGSEATLINDSNSSAEFIAAIRNVLANHEESINKARLLQKKLIKKHSKEHFIEQVKEMLQRSNNE